MTCTCEGTIGHDYTNQSCPNNDPIKQVGVDTITQAHVDIDAHLATLRGRIEEVMLDHAAEGYDISFEAVVGQILMEVVCASSCGMTSDHKVFLVRVAEHMGPDWAQSLYHTARFITKVA